MSIAVGARGFTLNMVETTFSKTVEHKPFKGSELLFFELQRDAQIPNDFPSENKLDALQLGTYVL